MVINGMKGEYAKVNGIDLFFMHGGKNKDKPLFLVHGLFETGMMWRRVAPKLMENYYLVIADLRGYGKSDKPDDISKMDKRTQAKDLYELAKQLGLEKFVMFSHDRGARVGRRYALDYPETLKGIALLDILPTEYIYQEMTIGQAGAHHWDQLFKLASPISELLLEKEEQIKIYVNHFYNRTKGFIDILKADGVYDYYIDTITKPGAMKSMLNDYRAAYTYDVPLLRDELNRGVKIQVPTMILWGSNGNLSRSPAMDIWRPRCAELEGYEVPCGHYIPEEAPETTLQYLTDFAEKCFARD